MQQPKNITKNFKFRNVPYGNDRRVMMENASQENQPHFPKAVGYADIDQAVFDWVDKELEITYSGAKLPTYKLFSTQRLSEYAQNWASMDEKGNLNLNFKTITREINPQHGELSGNYYNIPGNRDYVIKKTYIAEEKGDEVVQIYTMKQPFDVNLIYTMNIITNSLSVINEMNTKILNEFKSLTKYIFPNAHPMPMELNSVGDESDYTIDDRKYYSQSYQFKVMAYIINEEDFKVTKVRSRLRNQFISGENAKYRSKKDTFDIGLLADNEQKIIIDKINDGKCSEFSPSQIQVVKNNNIEDEIYGEPLVEMDVLEGLQECWVGTEYAMSVNRKISYNLTLNAYKSNVEFTIEQSLMLETLSLKNVRSIKVFINDNEIHIDDSDVKFDSGDKIKIEVTLKNPRDVANINIVCYDPSSIEGESEEFNV